MKDILAIVGVYTVCKVIWRSYNTHVKPALIELIDEVTA